MAYRTAAVVAMVGVLCASRAAAAQELGNKLLGATGINAGTQPAPGLYVLDRVVVYRADQLRDRNGDALPITSLAIDVSSNVLGVAYTRALHNRTFFNAAFGAPLARITFSADHPLIATDASGFGDLFVQPIKVGARRGHFDAVADYTFYAPSGHFEPRRLTVGRGFWTHELSLGGAFYVDSLRTRRASLLASYDMNLRKREIDITRGNSVQVQGGAGARLAGPVDAGLAGFAMWQITNNHGSDLPDALHGARTRVFGLGPEVDVAIPAIRARIDLRGEREFGVRSRQQGWIVVLGAAVQACCSTR